MTQTRRTVAQDLQGVERGRPPAANTPPFRSMEELMDGELSYVVAVPNTPEAALTVQVCLLAYTYTCCRCCMFLLSLCCRKLANSADKRMRCRGPTLSRWRFLCVSPFGVVKFVAACMSSFYASSRACFSLGKANQLYHSVHVLPFGVILNPTGGNEDHTLVRLFTFRCTRDRQPPPFPGLMRLLSSLCVLARRLGSLAFPHELNAIQSNPPLIENNTTYTRTCTHARPHALRAAQAGARARAPAWRDVDSRIRRGIPLVAPSICRDPVPLVESGARMVTVTLKYTGRVVGRHA